VSRIPPAEKVECVSSKVAPVIDSLIGAYQVVRTGYALGKAESEYAGQPISRNADIGFGVGLAALFISSAVYGYVTTGDCADAKEQHAAARGSEPNRPNGPVAAPVTFTVNPSSGPPRMEPPPEPPAPPPQPAAPLAPAPPAVSPPPAPEPYPAAPGPSPAPPPASSSSFPEVPH
jgi:hypothetical protein